MATEEQAVDEFKQVMKSSRWDRFKDHMVSIGFGVLMAVMFGLWLLREAAIGRSMRQLLGL